MDVVDGLDIYDLVLPPSSQSVTGSIMAGVHSVSTNGERFVAQAEVLITTGGIFWMVCSRTTPLLTSFYLACPRLVLTHLCLGWFKVLCNTSWRNHQHQSDKSGWPV